RDEREPDCPTGKSRICAMRKLPVVLLCRRLPRLPRRANQWLPSARPALDKEGRFAVVTNVGCGMRWTLWRRADERRQGGRRRRVVLAPRRWCQVGGSNSADDGGKRARSPGRARRKP